MRKILSIAAIMVMVLSLTASISMAQMPAHSVVWVDDDYESDDAPYFTSLDTAVDNVAPGGTVHIAPGAYDACDIQRDMTLVGAGARDVTIDCSSVPLDISDVSFFSITGCTLEGGADNIRGYFDTMTDITITECVIRGATTPASGIHLSVDGAEASIEIANNQIVDNSGHGIAISYTNLSAGAMTISDNVITGNTNGGISLVCGELSDFGDIEFTVRNNVVDENTTGPGLAIIVDSNYFPLVTVDENTFKQNDVAGILFGVQNVYTSTRNEVEVPSVLSFTNNEITGNNGDGVCIMDATIVGDDAMTIGDTIEEEVIFFFDIAKNMISSNAGHGISCGIGNDVSTPDLLTENGNEVTIQFMNIPTIRRNVITDNGGDGLHLDCRSFWIIFNNLIAHNQQTGISLGGEGCLAANNTIAYNGMNGIEFNELYRMSQGIPLYSLEGIYLNNIVALNEGYGIFLGETTPKSLGDVSYEHLPFITNDVWGNEAGNYVPEEFDVTGSMGNISRDPLFTSSRDLHLHVGSPCIDSGIDIQLDFSYTDLDGSPRPRGKGTDMGCYEYEGIPFTPETFQPLVTTQLAHANTVWTCIMGNLPDDPELMEEVEPMLEEVQSHMANATSISNYVQANGELRQALSIMAEIDAMCECGCMQGP